MSNRFDHLPFKTKPVLFSVKSFGRGKEFQVWKFTFENQEEADAFGRSYGFTSLVYGYGASINNTETLPDGKVVQTISMSNSAD